MGHYPPDLLSLGLYTCSSPVCVSNLDLQAGDTGILKFSRPVWGSGIFVPKKFSDQGPAQLWVSQCRAVYLPRPGKAIRGPWIFSPPPRFPSLHPGDRVGSFCSTTVGDTSLATNLFFTFMLGCHRRRVQKKWSPRCLQAGPLPPEQVCLLPTWVVGYCLFFSVRVVKLIHCNCALVHGLPGASLLRYHLTSGYLNIFVMCCFFKSSQGVDYGKMNNCLIFPWLLSRSCHSHHSGSLGGAITIYLAFY